MTSSEWLEFTKLIKKYPLRVKRRLISPKGSQVHIFLLGCVNLYFKKKYFCGQKWFKWWYKKSMTNNNKANRGCSNKTYILYQDLYQMMTSLNWTWLQVCPSGLIHFLDLSGQNGPKLDSQPKLEKSVYPEIDWNRSNQLSSLLRRSPQSSFVHFP